MSQSNQQFAADLRAATAEIGQALSAVAWLRDFASAALSDPRTPLEAIEAIDRSLSALRGAIPGIDAAVANALASYADRFGREYQPTNFQLN